MKSKAKINAVTGMITQIVIVILGLVVPRIMIKNYGSDTNGLTNTLTQIFSYVALLEAGIGQATKNALYKPITEKNEKEAIKVLSASRLYYWRITKYYALIVFLMAVILPFVIKTSLSWKVVCGVILFEGMSGLIGFMFTENWMQLLYAEGKGYVQANINLVTRILTYTVKIVLACLNVNIVLIQVSYFLISLTKLLIYKVYIDKHYKWLKYDLKAAANYKLPDRNSYVLTEIAWTVFSSTDMILLSIIFSTELSSVYSIYNMIYSNISLLLSAVYLGLIYVLGQSYHESLEKYKTIHDEFEWIFMTAIALLMSCCSALAVPFVRIYTGGVTDVNYVYIFLPYLFGLVQILSWDRYVSGNLSGIAGYAKIVSKISAAEAAMNIILSVLLSTVLGIYGITLATVLSLIFKLSYLTIICNKKIMHRSPRKSATKIIAYLLVYTAISITFVIRPLEITTVVDFVKYGAMVFALIVILYGLIAVAIDVKSAKGVMAKFVKKEGLQKNDR